LTGKKGTTPGGLEKQEWKSKHCDFRFYQARNANGKTWNTGIWKKKLESIASGNPWEVKGCIKAIERAKYILQKRWYGGSVTVLAKGMKFFSFEENLVLQIHEGLVVISTGSTHLSLTTHLSGIGFTLCAHTTLLFTARNLQG